MDITPFLFFRYAAIAGVCSALIIPTLMVAYFVNERRRKIVWADDATAWAKARVLALAAYYEPDWSVMPKAVAYSFGIGFGLCAAAQIVGVGVWAIFIA